MLSVLFVGSCNHIPEKSNEFATFCEQLGYAIAGAHKVLVCGTIELTADHSVVTGAYDRLHAQEALKPGAPRLFLYHTKGDKSETSNNEVYQLLKSLDGKGAEVIKKKVEGDSFDLAIRSCDVIVVVGGQNTSSNLVERAVRERKPVLGFTQFGGIGLDANRQLDRVYQLMKIPSGLTEVLEEPVMDAQSVSKVCQLIGQIHRRNPWAETHAVKKTVLSLLVLALTMAWIWTFRKARDGAEMLDFEPLFWIFPACMLAGVVGSLASFVISDIASWRELRASTAPIALRGLVPGLGIATFAKTVVGMVYHGSINAPEFSFEPLVLFCSFFALMAGLIGVKSIEKALEFLHIEAK